MAQFTLTKAQATLLNNYRSNSKDSYSLRILSDGTRLVLSISAKTAESSLELYLAQFDNSVNSIYFIYNEKWESGKYNLDSYLNTLTVNGLVNRIDCQNESFVEIKPITYGSFETIKLYRNWHKIVKPCLEYLSKDKTKDIINYPCLMGDSVYATDGHRIITVKLNNEDLPTGERIVMPIKSSMLKALPECQVSYCTEYMMFYNNEFSLIIKRPSYTYPDAKMIMDRTVKDNANQYELTLVLSKAQLQAIKNIDRRITISYDAENESGMIKAIDDNGKTLVLDHNSIHGNYSGQFGIDSHYLISMFNVGPTGYVRLNMQSNSDCITSSRLDYTVGIMPLGLGANAEDLRRAD